MEKCKPRRGAGGGSGGGSGDGGRVVGAKPGRRGSARIAGDRPTLWGRHAVLAALENPARTGLRLLATTEALVRAPEVKAAAERRGAPVETIDRAALDAVTPHQAAHRGLALIAAPLPAAEIENLAETLAAAGAGALVLLDRVSDPRNVGAVLRSAAAFGAAGLVMQDRHAPAETGALAKAASGALETVPIAHETNLARALDAARQRSLWIVGFDDAAEQRLGAAAVPQPAVLCFGAEGTGLRRLTRERCDMLVGLPTGEAMASLNVSNAVAVALYETLGRSG